MSTRLLWIVLTLDNIAGIGVDFRDNEGRWLYGTARFLGGCIVLLVELWAIHDDLIHAWSRGYRRIELESDSLEVMKITNLKSTVMKENGLVLSTKR
ncbi:hypothetical protein V6N12_023734 [Hibiscus sabdariffa]|uniref:RNase H type-1 domain-containing protein n=1 Tax=Hibiscus sabdariffa TaxID=183260 RepID=A0ABR2FZ67_9ROSI